MKLLLTSAGITNKTLANQLLSLLGKPFADTTVVFIPTAANPIAGEKEWLIEDLNELRELGFKWIDVIDLAWPGSMWRGRVESADLICVGGGNEQYLAKAMQDSGFGALLPELLKSRVYMGISAGSMVMGQFLSHDLLKVVYPEEAYEDLAAPLGLVKILFVPHLNSPDFSQCREEVLKSLNLSSPLYSADDNTALRVENEIIEVVGEGAHVKI